MHRLTQVRTCQGAQQSTRRNPEGLTYFKRLRILLPDFKNLDEEQHLKFVKAIRLLCSYFDISEGRLQKDHFFKLRSTIARLSELYDEYHDKDAILVSAILILKLHIGVAHLDSPDA